MRGMVLVATIAAAAHADVCEREKRSVEEMNQIVASAAGDAYKLAAYKAALEQRENALRQCEEQEHQRAEDLALQKMRAQEAAQEEQRAAQLENDPTAQRVAWSALLCAWQADRAEAMHEIGQYRRAARIGGVLDLEQINEWQGEVMRAERHIRDAKASLRALKTKPISCKADLVSRISPCLTDEVRAAGECAEAAPYWRIARGRE